MSFEALQATTNTHVMLKVLTYSTNDRITFREAKEQATLGNVDKTSKMEDILAAVRFYSVFTVFMHTFSRKMYVSFIEPPNVPKSE